MLIFENFNKKDRLERLQLVDACRQYVENYNLCGKAFGYVTTALESIALNINVELDKLPKNNCGRVAYNYEFECDITQKVINVYHIKISTGERDELVCKIIKN